MIGIVLVSHSYEIAVGAAALAREMGGPEVRIQPVGGLDQPDHPIGTDAVMVMDAIERAWSDDGVLVLMDLGSAVLSTEMALDMLGPERRAKVLLTDAPFVEGAVAAAVTAKLGSSLEEVAAEARTGLAGKSAHLGTDTAGPSLGATERPPVPTSSIRLVVPNPHGLHARPAARFVQKASAYDADVRVANATAGRGPVTARSLNAVATLGVTRGDEIEVTASGPQAEAALEAIRTLAAEGFGEAPEMEAPSVDAAAGAAPFAGAPAVVGPDLDGRHALRGIATAAGIAIGPARRFHAPELSIPDRAAEDGEIELRELEDALRATERDIQAQRAAVAGRAGEYQASIFDAHLLFLRDEALLNPVREAIRSGASAAPAWHDEIERMSATWERLDDEYQRARAGDLRSVGVQVLAHLLGVPPPRPRLDSPGILLAADLTPADTAGLAPALALGVATAFGGPTSHAAVLARALGIPAVVGLGEALLGVAEGTTVGIDGAAGLLYVDPDPELVDRLGSERDSLERTGRAARERALAEAITLDGVRIHVLANIGSPQDVPVAVEAGCDGVGLFRTEFLFMERAEMPDEDEQEAAYRRAAELLDGRPMIVRTLDVGADKPLPFLAQPPEPNPFLGVRGLRLALARPEVLATQLRAILRVAADHPVRVMFPMVATIDELRAAIAALETARAELTARAVPLPGSIEAGVMIEVPAAALTAGALAEEAAFFSIGTNDLTQYALAADRGNERVAALSDPLHPAVLELIRRTVAGAEALGRPVGICGELAGDATATPLLLGLGVRELSMSGPAIPAVKDAVRATDLGSARELAKRALERSSAAAVRELLRTATT